MIYNKIHIITLGILLFLGQQALAQVGIQTNQAKASLHITPVSTASGTAEGIIAPNLTRAQVISKDTQYSADQTGALVYITDINGVSTNKTQNITHSGYYYFDGTIWQYADKVGQYFYLPTFDLPTTTVGTGYTFDLYTDVYKKQFTKAGNTSYQTSNNTLTNLPVGRYAANELDYVITYYDTDVIKVNSISNTGVVNYDVKSTSLGPKSFINVVLITKR